MKASPPTSPQTAMHRLSGDAAIAARASAPADGLALVALRAGMALMAVVAATDCVFALVAGAGALTAVEGVAITGIAVAGMVYAHAAARLLLPTGRVVLLAAAFAAAGALDVGVQRHFTEVAAAIGIVAAVVATPRWVALCVTVSAVGFVGDLALHGRSLEWMLGAGRSDVAGQLVNLVANAAAGVLMIALLRRFVAGAPLRVAAVRAGGPSLTPQLALAARERHHPELPAADARVLIAPLTRGERAVVALLAEGRVPKQAAVDLSIALPTVRSRLAAAKRKTGARTLDQLVALYAEAELAP